MTTGEHTVPVVVSHKSLSGSINEFPHSSSGGVDNDNTHLSYTTERILL